jgi:AAA+ ATPase superfamily predicted ATPase
MDKHFTLIPVYGEGFVGRKDIIKELSQEISNPKSHIGFALHGRRRVGKTSILKEIEYETKKKKGIVVAYLSLYKIADLSLKTFTDKLSETVLEAFRKKKIIPFEHTIETLMKSPKEIIESLLSKFNLGTALSQELNLFLQYRKEKEINYTKLIERAFDLGDKLANYSDTKFVLVLDEFPEILKIENGLQIVKMFRTLHEDQKNTMLIISGSEKKTLETVALSGASPLYKQLIPKKIRPFTFEETSDFFKTYNVGLPEEESKRLYEMTGGVPFYLQYIGRSTTITKDIDKAINEFIKEEGNVFFTEEFEKLSDKEQIVCIAISKGATTPSEIADLSEEPVTSVSVFLLSLQDKGVVKKIDKGKYELIDNLFSIWMQRKYG